MIYKVLQKNKYELDNYTLLPYRSEDMFLIMNWRNDQMNILRQKTLLTPKDQKKYYLSAIKPSFEEETPDIILFSFLKDNTCIGYGGLTNIDWDSKRAEVSCLLETSRTKDEVVYQTDFTFFLSLLKQVAFEDLGFHRLFTEAYDIRPLHISVLIQNGFILEGKLKDHVIIDGNFVDSLIHGLINN